MRAGAFLLYGRRQSRLVGARIGEHDFQICAALQPILSLISDKVAESVELALPFADQGPR
jgi:hypothetical protein